MIILRVARTASDLRAETKEHHLPYHILISQIAAVGPMLFNDVARWFIIHLKSGDHVQVKIRCDRDDHDLDAVIQHLSEAHQHVVRSLIDFVARRQS